MELNELDLNEIVQMLPDVDALELGDDTDDGQIGSDGPSNEDYAALHSRVLDKGKLTVTGSNEAGEMKWALEQISDKTIVFE
jgi:hypothetical protein